MPPGDYRHIIKHFVNTETSNWIISIHYSYSIASTDVDGVWLLLAIKPTQDGKDSRYISHIPLSDTNKIRGSRTTYGIHGDWHIQSMFALKLCKKWLEHKQTSIHIFFVYQVVLHNLNHPCHIVYWSAMWFKVPWNHIKPAGSGAKDHQEQNIGRHHMWPSNMPRTLWESWQKHPFLHNLWIWNDTSEGYLCITGQWLSIYLYYWGQAVIRGKLSVCVWSTSHNESGSTGKLHIRYV